MKKLSIFLTLLLALAVSIVFAADTTYGPKVYKDTGGDREVIASGGKVSVESGGSIDIESGGYITGLGLKKAAKAMSAAVDWTLSAAEAICNFLEATASGSGDSIIAPDIAGRIYIVRNATDSTITIKKSGGTGVQIASGKTAIVIHNGSDYVRVTADATH